MILKVIGMFLLLLLQHRLMLIIFPQNMAKLSPFLLKTFLKAVQNRSLFSKNCPEKFPRISHKISLFSCKIVSENPINENYLNLRLLHINVPVYIYTTLSMVCPINPIANDK